jgi:hypothetical protein
MRCASCNFELPDGAKYCSACGAAADGPINASTTTARRAKVVAADTVKTVGITAAQTAKVIGVTAQEGLNSEMGKSIATGATLGAVIAMPIPFVGSALGASIGAIIGAVRKF